MSASFVSIAERRARKAGSLRNLLINAIVRSASSSLSTYIDNRWSSSTRVPAMSTTLSRSSLIAITLVLSALPK